MKRTILALSMGVLAIIGLTSERAPVARASEEKLAVSALANSDVVYTQLRGVKLSGESALVEDFSFKRDTAKFSFQRGEFFFLAPVEGKVTGAVFIGEGQFHITPTLAIEQRHLSILTGFPSITDKFTKMVIRFSDGTYEQIKKSSPVRTGQPLTEAQSLLDENRKLLRKSLRDNIELRMLLDLTWPNQPGCFYAFFNGKQYGNMLFGLDPLGVQAVAPEEIALICLDQDKQGIWVASHLNSHYKDQNVFRESHQLVDLEHHKIDATVKGKRLDAVVETRVKALVEGARVLPFSLFSRLRVRKVTDDKGKELAFIQENENEDSDFAVILPEGVQKGAEYRLKFEYGGEDAVAESGGGNYTLVARTNWYPNSSFGDRATYEITMRTPKALTMVATGQPMGESEEGEWRVTRWQSDIPLAVAGFNYGRFKKGSITDDKTKYTFETYANKELPDDLKSLINARSNQVQSGSGMVVEQNTLQSINPVNLMDKARAEAQISVAMYSSVFGPLPYGRIAMTQQPAPNFGQAWPMLIYMPLTAFLDGNQRNQLGLSAASDFFKFVGPHEVAHQWWGHIIGWQTYRDQWMSEGFSEFSASLYAQAIYKNEKFIEFWKELREQILTKNREGKRPSDVGGVYMGYRLNTAKTGNIYRSMVYPKGAFILHMIRMMMFDAQTGDQRFSEMMKDFVKTHYNQNVTTQDFIKVVEKHMTKEMDLDGSGKMDWFLFQWIYGHQIPDYKLEYRLEPAADGQTRLIGKITQSNVDNSFKMVVPVYLDFGGNNITKLGSVPIAGNSTSPEFNVVLPKKPKRVVLCAYEDVLCTTDAR